MGLNSRVHHTCKIWTVADRCLWGYTQHGMAWCLELAGHHLSSEDILGQWGDHPAQYWNKTIGNMGYSWVPGTQSGHCNMCSCGPSSIPGSHCFCSPVQMCKYQPTGDLGTHLLAPRLLRGDSHWDAAEWEWCGNRFWVIRWGFNQQCPGSGLWRYS